jgi:F-type H+-transporting ATPase subunit b
MKIEISQLLTHAVGFLIVFWVLKKFAWKPILRLLDDRRQKIADEFTRIETKKQETEALLLEYETRLKRIEEEARAKMNESVAEGQKIAAEIKAGAQEEARSIISRAKSELERDVVKARAQLKQDLVGMTLNATERLLRERIDEKANRKLIERFLDEVETAA